MAESPDLLKAKERIDILQARANEEATMRRHHETLRDRAGATFLTLSTALLALFGTVSGRTGPAAGAAAVAIPLAVTVVGLFGVLVVARHSDHVLRHMAAESLLRERASAESARAGGEPLSVILDQAKARYEESRGTLMAGLARMPTRWLWMIPNLTIALFGALLAAAALRTS